MMTCSRSRRSLRKPPSCDDRCETKGRRHHTWKPRRSVRSPSNVIGDIMAALKNSLGLPATQAPPAPKRKKKDDARQTGLKLPIKGGKVAAERVEASSAPAAKPVRKRA